MKHVFTIIFACSGLLAQVAHELPFGSEGNTLALDIENPETIEISGLTLVPVTVPDWIRLDEGDTKIGTISGGQRATVYLRFAVAPAAPVQKPATLAFILENETGHQWRKEIRVSVAPPMESELLPNYPNPFNPTTTVAYQLSSTSQVRLSVYDLLGREIMGLEEGTKFAGYHEVPVDARTWASGMYIVRLVATQTDGQEFTVQRIMTVVR